MNRGASLLVTLIVAAAGSDAAACGYDEAWGIDLRDDEWREYFALNFDSAERVLVVTASAAAAAPQREAWRYPCDKPVYSPPLAGKSRRAKAEHRRAQAAAEAAGTACQAENVRFDVQRVLKGPPITTWIESKALIDVIDEPAPEPLFPNGPVYGARLAFAGIDWMCDRDYVRRLSSGARYLVFIDPIITSTDGESFSRIVGSRLGTAYLIDERTPFLKEAERLSAREP